MGKASVHFCEEVSSDPHNSYNVGFGVVHVCHPSEMGGTGLRSASLFCMNTKEDGRPGLT